MFYKKRNLLSFRVLMLFLLFLLPAAYCLLPAVLYAGDIEAELTTFDGTTSFDIKDSLGVTVSSITSDGDIYGNLLRLKGSGNNWFLGNVGIGTTNPSAKLHLDGSLRISGSATNTIMYNPTGAMGGTAINLGGGTLGLANSGANLVVINSLNGSSDGNLLNVQEGGVTRFIVKQEGNVGIGTAGPAGVLHVRAAGTDAIVVSTITGNVGIGTASPTDALQVIGNMRVGASGNNLFFDINPTSQHSINWYLLGYPKIIAKISSVGNDTWGRRGLAFFTGDYTTGSTDADERMRIDKAGNVGIGTSSPTTKFVVKDGSITVTGINANLLVAGNVGIGTASPFYKLSIEGDFGTGGMGGLFVYNTSNFREFSIGWGASYPRLLGNGGLGLVGTNAIDRDDLFITFNGNVGIGNITPNSLLYVQGPIATAIRTEAVNYTITDSDSIILGNASAGAINVTLPTAVGIAGRQYTIKKIDAVANNVTVLTFGTETIDEQDFKTMGSQNQFVVVVSDGANWFIVGEG